MKQTTNLLLKKPDLEDYVNVADLNDNADIIDNAITTEKEKLTTHLAERATLTKLGHVQLSSAVTSVDETKAATPKSVKQAYDLADAAFTSASNGKAAIGNAVTGVDPKVVIPPEPTFNDLANAIGQISTGLIKTLAPGDEWLLYNDTTRRSYDYQTFTKVREVKSEVSGIARISFSLESTNSAPVQGRIYINGAPVGLLRALNTFASSGTFTEDISLEKGDYIQLYVNKNTSSGTPKVIVSSYTLSAYGPNIINKIS